MKKKLILSLLLCFCLCLPVVALAGCGDDPGTLKYTVTFDTNGGSTIAPIEVDKNKRVQKPTDPVRGEDTFAGWFTDNTTFLNEWNFDINIVAKDTTLYAKWLTVYNYPSSIQVSNSEPFFNEITWMQSGISDQTTTFVVKVAGTEKAGTWTYANNKVTFTFTDTVYGGLQNVEIATTRTDLTDSIQTVSVTLPLKGNGTEADPYRIYANTAETDLLAVTNGTFASTGKYFQLEENVVFESNFDAKNNTVFSGVFNGNDKTIDFSGTTNCGIFYEIGADGVVKNVKFTGTVTTTQNLFAPVAKFNRGLVDNIYTLMQIVSEQGTIGQAFSGNVNDIASFVGGGAGVVGVNYATGTISNSTMKSESSSNTLKVANGGGGMAAINYGTITGCEMQACIGGYNSVEVGKSGSKYSFLGGIAGYNYGAITGCEISGTGKILAQRYADNSDAKNIAIGGMAGINGATGVIINCHNEAIRVHGDTYVGGIAGINQGIIKACDVGFARKSTDILPYIGGRNWVGGIAGKVEGTGTVSNCLVVANVYAHNSTSEETKQFAVASHAENCVYVSKNLNARTMLNSNIGSVNTSNDLTAPVGTNNIAIPVEENSNLNKDSDNVYVPNPDEDAFFYVIANDAIILNCLNSGLDEALFANDANYGIRLSAFV